MGDGLVHSLKKSFKAIDTENTGLITIPELEGLVKKCSPDFGDGDLAPILAKMKVTDGKVRFDDFVDFVFGTSNVKPLSRKEMQALAKPPTDEELQDMISVFGKYDKDKSGFIDLKELQAMCESLGKKLTDAQATQAMQQLDRDGNLKCDFEEFKLWFTSTSGLGGYGHVALGFMKTKLQMEGAFRKLKKRAKKVIESADDFACRLCVDVSPDLKNPSKQACSAKVCMRKLAAPTNDLPCVTMKLTAESEESAKKHRRSHARADHELRTAFSPHQT